MFVTPSLPFEAFYVKFFVVQKGAFGDLFPILKLDFPHSYAIMGAYTKYINQCFLLWEHPSISQESLLA